MPKKNLFGNKRLVTNQFDEKLNLNTIAHGIKNESEEYYSMA